MTCFFLFFIKKNRGVLFITFTNENITFKLFVVLFMTNSIENITSKLFVVLFMTNSIENITSNYL